MFNHDAKRVVFRQQIDKFGFDDNRINSLIKKVDIIKQALSLGMTISTLEKKSFWDEISKKLAEVKLLQKKSPKSLTDEQRILLNDVERHVLYIERCSQIVNSKQQNALRIEQLLDRINSIIQSLQRIVPTVQSTLPKKIYDKTFNYLSNLMPLKKKIVSLLDANKSSIGGGTNQHNMIHDP